MISSNLHLVMPMGGAGTRFFDNGFIMPKPLIEINGKPFFYWATQSITKFIRVLDLTFVVLQQHIEEFEIDKKIMDYYPEAKIVVIPEVLPGAVMTCLAGIDSLNDGNPILFNDCDHMFKCSEFCDGLNNINYDGALLTFKSNEPQFSYVRYENEKIVGTVEKVVVSDDAICGAYVIRNAELFKDAAEIYLKNCCYKEFFVSGIYNVLCDSGYTVKNYSVDYHVPFGTPSEYELAKDSVYFEELL